MIRSATRLIMNGLLLGGMIVSVPSCDRPEHPAPAHTRPNRSSNRTPRTHAHMRPDLRTRPDIRVLQAGAPSNPCRKP